MCRHLAAVLAAAEKMHLDGNDVHLAGDFNLHLGEEIGVPNTNKNVSPGGRAFLSMMEDTDLHVVNSLNRSGGNGHTHYDRTAGTSNILDLVITNKPHNINWLEVDEKFEATPFRVRVKGGVKTSSATRLTSTRVSFYPPMGKRSGL